MARKPYTPPPPHSLFRDSFERHRHLIGPMLDGDEQALAELTSSKDGFRAALYARFCHDDTPYPIYQRYTDIRDLQPLFEWPIQVVAQEHPEWIGDLLLDAEAMATDPGKAMASVLMDAVERVLFPRQQQQEILSTEEIMAIMSGESPSPEVVESQDDTVTVDRELPASLGEYCLSLFRSTRQTQDWQRQQALRLLIHYRPIPADTFQVMGRHLAEEPDREIREMLIEFLDSAEAGQALDPQAAPALLEMRQRRRRSISPEHREALDRIIRRLGVEPTRRRAITHGNI